MSVAVYKSQSVAYSAGSRITIPLDWLPRRGERGGRLIVQRLEVRLAGVYTTGAGVTLDGNDLHGTLTRIEVRDAAGYRWNLSGEGSKLAAQIDMRRRMPADPADVIANTADQARTVIYPMPFSRLQDFGPDDCALAVDDLLDGGEVAIMWAATSALPWAGGTGTIVAATTTLVLYAYCREEFDVQLHARDERNYLLQDQVATIRVPVNGNLLRYVYLHQDGVAGGGGDLQGITEMTIDTLRQIAIPYGVMTNLHLEEGGPVYNASADDLVLNNRAFPVVIAAEREKMRDRPRIDGALLGRLTTTETVTASQVYHLITPKDARVVQNALTVNQVPPEAQITVKTIGKSLKDPSAWGAYAAYMPEKVAAA